MKPEKSENAEIASDHAYVVYHTMTGHIHHVHRVITLKGSTEPKPDEIKTRALELARKGAAESPFETLMVPSEHLHLGATHKVDPKKKSLISEPMKPRSRATPA